VTPRPIARLVGAAVVLVAGPWVLAAPAVQASVPPVAPDTTLTAPDPAATSPVSVTPVMSTPDTSSPGTSTTLTTVPEADEEQLDPVELAPVQPIPSLPPIEDPNALSSPLVPIPAGCPTPREEQAVFVGTLVVHDEATARFVVGRVRSGTLAGFTVAGLVDVRYGDEARFLDAGTTYLVGAGIDERTGLLSSTVRAPAPLFGGNEVAGVSATDLVCPSIDDPVRTLLLDGTNVESGVATPIIDAKREVLRAILQPIGVALLVVIGLASLKLLVFAAGRSIRDVGERRPKPTVNRPVPARRARRRALRALGDVDR
jgi:hypothetical protein